MICQYDEKQINMQCNLPELWYIVVPAPRNPALVILAEYLLGHCSVWALPGPDAAAAAAVVAQGHFLAVNCP